MPCARRSATRSSISTACPTARGWRSTICGAIRRSTRAVILDGVLPADIALGPGIALDAQHALERMFERCAGDGACSEHFPDLREHFAELNTRLGETPLALTLADPQSAEPVETRFGPAELDAAVRLLSYATDTVALLPLLLDHAADGEVAPLAAQSLMVGRDLGETLSEGMHNAVVCAEDVPYFDVDDAMRAALQATYLGTTQVDGLAAICEVWPSGVVDPDFKTPVVSDASGAAVVRRGRSGDAAAQCRARARNFVERPPPGRARTGARRGGTRLRAAAHRQSSWRPPAPRIWTRLHEAPGAGAFLHQLQRTGTVIEVERLCKSFGKVRAVQECLIHRARRPHHRAARTQRRRQVDDLADALHRAAPGRRPRAHRRHRHRRRSADGATAHRRAAARRRPVSESHRARKHSLSRPPERHERRGARAASGRADRGTRSGRHCRSPRQAASRRASVRASRSHARSSTRRRT